MNYYERHIGDYLKDTAHLSLLEHGIYTRLMDVYYTRECAIPAKEAARLIGARSKDEREALETVLAEFFVLVDGVHRQERCEREIERYHDKTPDREAKRENDRERQRRARERRKDLFEALRSHGVVPAFDATTAELEALLSRQPKRDGHADVTPPVTRDNTATQTPDTRHQYSEAIASGDPTPPSKTRPAKKCPESFAMTDDLVQWAKDTVPGISIASETAKFRDHTFSRAITDWPGTWRNWMRKAFEDRKGIAKGGPPEPEWRREQRERNEAFLGPAAAKRSTAQPETLEIFDVAARRVG